MPVFLRVRPFSKEELERDENQVKMLPSTFSFQELDFTCSTLETYAFGLIIILSVAENAFGLIIILSVTKKTIYSTNIPWTVETV